MTSPTATGPDRRNVLRGAAALAALGPLCLLYTSDAADE